MKKGDKVLCKKSAFSYFEDGLSYNVNKIYDTHVLICDNAENDYWGAGYYFSLIGEEVAVKYFYDYFYSLNDMRKLKLEKICQ